MLLGEAAHEADSALGAIALLQSNVCELLRPEEGSANGPKEKGWRVTHGKNGVLHMEKLGAVRFTN